MLMHSCYCIFISVTGGFVQMLKDFKNLLKMSLKILFIKRKREFPSIPPLPLIRPMAIFFPAAQHRSQRPSPPFPARPSFVPAAQPRAPRWPSRASPAARTVPAQPRQPSSRAPRRRPHPATARAQPLTPGPHLSAPPPTSRIPRPLPVKAEPPFSALASWERPPRAPRPR